MLNLGSTATRTKSRFKETQNPKLKVQNESSKPKANLRERSYQFSISLIVFLKSLPRDPFNVPLVNQLLRCGTSVGANIAEAQGASSKKDFAKFYDIALKSAHETIHWLSLFADGLGIKSGEIGILKREAGELANILGASLLTMRNKR